MIVKFEKGVPLPNKGRPGEFADMQVGDSCICTAKQYRALSSYSRTKGWKVTCRTQGDGTYRMWRLE